MKTLRQQAEKLALKAFKEFLASSDIASRLDSLGVTASDVGIGDVDDAFKSFFGESEDEVNENV